MDNKVDFWNLLNQTQEYISQYYAAVLTDPQKLPQLKSYIEKYLRDLKTIQEEELPDLVDRIYCEMAEYSILTKYLGSPYLEEININAWNDIALTYLDGNIVKAEEAFHSPQHAIDIIKRLLHHSKMVIDDATPIAQGHLPQNTRIASIKTPIMDDTAGISASIRLLHSQRITHNMLLSTNSATAEMLDFLSMCIRYGVSVIISGATSTGKTTLLNALLCGIPDNKRVFTIESGSREFTLVRSQDGHIMNNIVHTLSRPSENPAHDISQEDLVVMSLRYNPAIIAVGEMRDVEAYAAQEAALTGHTVVSTVHAGAGMMAHVRIALLCQKRFSIDFNTALMQTGMAFPIIVYTDQLEDNSRKIMDISECEMAEDGTRQYHSLYAYSVDETTEKDGKTSVTGHFNKTNIISERLKKKLVQHGIPQDKLNRFLNEGDEKK